MKAPFQRNDRVFFRLDPEDPESRRYGVVSNIEYIGRTKVGNIPDYKVTIDSEISDRRITVSLVENYVKPKS